MGLGLLKFGEHHNVKLKMALSFLDFLNTRELRKNTWKQNIRTNNILKLRSMRTKIYRLTTKSHRLQSVKFTNDIDE